MSDNKGTNADGTILGTRLLGETYIVSTVEKNETKTPLVAQDISNYASAPTTERLQLGYQNLDSKDYYEWKNGFALIINNEHFYHYLGLSQREGTKYDEKDVKRILERFRFKVEVIKDGNKEDILEQLEKAARRNDFDCLFVFVMTHGKEGDTLYACDGTYEKNMLWERFNGRNCPHLVQKPKVFIIQACRGSDRSRAAKIDSDSAPMTPTKTIPVEADILVAHSSYTGQASFRHTEEGSWFIQELFEEININGEQDDFVSLLTRVNYRVALKENNYLGIVEKQMPVIQSTMTKKLYLTGNNLTNLENNFLSAFQNIERNLNDRFDSITDLMEDKRGGNSSIKVFKKPGIRWSELKYSLEKSDVALPDSLKVLNLAKELKKYFQEQSSKTLPRDVLEYGKLLLNQLYFWECMEDDQRCFIYKRLLKFIVKNTKAWYNFQVFGVDKSIIAGIESGNTRWSQVEVPEIRRESVTQLKQRQQMSNDGVKKKIWQLYQLVQTCASNWNSTGYRGS
ncbi:unnamed protein product [Timema podura]|uniref:Caspase-8 n=1 Tax=Timema podura TaxID=61482 RepID=A0ABN7NYJ2_TIMPD|nr:unnamed protein product [Timema podura]